MKTYLWSRKFNDYLQNTSIRVQSGKGNFQTPNNAKLAKKYLVHQMAK